MPCKPLRFHDPGRPRCTTCGAEIVFVTMGATGRKMPVNPGQIIVPPADELRDGIDTAPKSLVVRDARGLGAVVYDPAPGTVGFVTHFATCATAHVHRKPATGNGPSRQLALFNATA